MTFIRFFSVKKDSMLSILKTIWTVFMTMFRKRATIQYPEERPYIPPRWRGTDHPLPRPRRRGALRGVLPLRRRLPC